MSLELIKELRERTGAGMMDCKKAIEASNGDMDAAIEWLRTNGIAKAAKKSDRIAAEGAIFISAKDNKGIVIELNSETDFVASNESFLEVGQKVADAIYNENLSDTYEGTKEDVKDIVIDGETIESILINLTATIGEKIELRRWKQWTAEGASTASYVHSNKNVGVIVWGKDIETETLRDVAMHAAAMKPEFFKREEISEEVIAKETQLAKDELAETLAGKPENIQENIIKGKVDKTLAENILLEQVFVKDSSKKVKDLAGSGEFLGFTYYVVGEGIEKKVENFAEEVAKQVNG